ncbi:hypothetical protein BpHYR1_053556 [Brachionus plicatilis]|uniref:Uncharacterized protein n=1 Tax=Brachionus plicatilis TaxID=10195 RepID=A0A3M7RRN8_BRAPC|nr:hypothetical protein BpHYR1_053556 [Brachionus plicatilis]
MKESKKSRGRVNEFKLLELVIDDKLNFKKYVYNLCLTNAQFFSFKILSFDGQIEVHDQIHNFEYLNILEESIKGQLEKKEFCRFDDGKIDQKSKLTSNESKNVKYDLRNKELLSDQVIIIRKLKVLIMGTSL